MKKLFLLFTVLFLSFSFTQYSFAEETSTSCLGYAYSVINEDEVTNSENSLGLPDGNVAIMDYWQGYSLTLDLTGDNGSAIAPGNIIKIHWRKTSGLNPLVDVEYSNEITGDWVIVNDNYEVTSEEFIEYSLPVTADTRYIAIYVDGPDVVDGIGLATLEVDAVTYTCNCLAPTPTVNVQDYCGYSILTASNYTGALTWNTGEETETITVTERGIYSVSQEDGDCLSLSGWATAAPYIIPGFPSVISGPEQPCDGEEVTYSIAAVTGATSYTWKVPEGWVVTAGNNTEGISVTVGTSGGLITVQAINDNCESNISELTVNPDLMCCWADQPDRYEPNNTMQEANAIVVGGELYANILNPKDPDWFSFVTDMAGLYTVNLAGAGESFILYNDLGRKLKPAERKGIAYSLLANTTYYIKVSSRVKVPIVCYSLGVVFAEEILFATEEYDDLKSAEIEIVPEEIFKIWPNPAKNEFNFYNGMEFPVQLRISDVTGRTVEIIENTGASETVRFGEKYISGLYFVETTGEGTRTKFKIIKQ